MTPDQARQINVLLRADPVAMHLAVLVSHAVAHAQRDLGAHAARLRESHRRSWNRIQNEARARRVANFMRFTEWPTGPRHFNCRCAPAP